MGGGGGSGTRGFGRNGGMGGNAGGMIIIIAGRVNGNGRKIISNGDNGQNSTGGAGGGGAGGTVALHVERYTSPLIVEINGGRGGNSNNSPVTGSGGGGGGGTLLFNQVVWPPLVTILHGPGMPGSPGHGATIGSQGGSFVNLILTLNGFLFQTILDEQKICEDTMPAELIGNLPFGGTAPYMIEWHESTDGITFNPIPGATNQNYQPPVLDRTHYYKRIVTDNSTPQIVDETPNLKTEVFPEIEYNDIISPQTICEGDSPLQLRDIQSPAYGGPGGYTFIWEKERTTPGIWDEVSTSTTNRHYQPPPLNQTTNYRRIVRTDYCVDISDPLHITVHPKITNNIISSSQTICFNNIPVPLTGLLPYGGNFTYSYSWEVNTTGTWRSAQGVNTGLNYSFLTALTETTQIRRTVSSGTCTDNSLSLTITVLPLISGNVIGSNQNICYNTSPQTLTGGPLSGGSGIYNYNWQSGTDPANFTSTGGTSSAFSPAQLTQPTLFRRIVTSGPCRDTSFNVSISIEPRPVEPITARAADMVLRHKFTTDLFGSSPSIGTGSWSVVAGSGTFAFPFSPNTEVNNMSRGINTFRWTVSHLNCPLVYGEVDVEVEDIFRPNAFSPNGDGINDFLKFSGLDNSLRNELTIFNRQGNIIFRAVNYQVAGSGQELWEGRDLSGNPVVADTYYYTLIVDDVNKYQGFIVLKR